jgi:hypothetical protein
MVKKPKIREEFFHDLKQSIEFWDHEVQRSEELLKQVRLNRNAQVRALKKLQKRYDKQ